MSVQLIGQVCDIGCSNGRLFLHNIYRYFVA